MFYPLYLNLSVSLYFHSITFYLIHLIITIKRKHKKKKKEKMEYTNYIQNDNQQMNYQLALLNYIPLNLFQNTQNVLRVVNSPIQNISNYSNCLHFPLDLFQFNQLQQQLQPIQQPIQSIQTQRNSQSDNAILYSNHRNYQVFQQSILICLLNKYADITIKRERKRSNVTLPFFTISNVVFNDNDIIDIDSYVQKRCIEIKEYDLNHNINIKTATRRFKTNRITEVIHTLIDLLRIQNEEIKTTMTRYKEGIKQSETMIKCQIEDREMNEKEIKKYGEYINSFLKTNMINDEIYLNRGSLYNYLVQLMNQ